MNGGNFKPLCAILSAFLKESLRGHQLCGALNLVAFHTKVLFGLLRKGNYKIIYFDTLYYLVALCGNSQVPEYIQWSAAIALSWGGLVAHKSQRETLW